MSRNPGGLWVKNFAGLLTLEYMFSKHSLDIKEP